MSKFIKIFILILNCSYSFQFSDNFHEELLIKQFPSNQINTYFQFTTQWNRVEDDTRKQIFLGYNLTFTIYKYLIFFYKYNTQI